MIFQMHLLHDMNDLFNQLDRLNVYHIEPFYIHLIEPK